MPFSGGVFNLLFKFGTGTSPDNMFPPKVGADLDDIATALTGIGPTGGGARTQRSVTSGPVTISGTDSILNLNLSSPTNISLPAAATRNGAPLTFKDVGGQAGAHNVTLTANGTEKIDGVSTLVMGGNYQAVTVNPFNDGVNTGWFIT